MGRHSGVCDRLDHIIELRNLNWWGRGIFAMVVVVLSQFSCLSDLSEHGQKYILLD